MPTARLARFRPNSAAASRTWSRRHRSFALPAFLALLGTAACGHAPPAGPAPRPITTLSHTDVDAVAAILRLEDRRELDTVALGRFTHSTAPEVRRRAYLAAGRIGGPGAAALARPGLRDGDSRARAAAAFALGLLRDTVSVDSLERVATSFSGSGPRSSWGVGQDAVAAVFALGRMNTRRAQGALGYILGWALPPGGRVDTVRIAPNIVRADHSSWGTGALSRPGVPAVAAQALLTIWRFRGRTDTTRWFVEQYAQNPDTALRWRAAYALMRLADPRSVPELERLLADPYPEVRALAARALRAPVTDSAGRRSEARTRLVAALQDSAPHVRINAAGALGTYHDSVLVDPLRALLRDRDVNVAIAAAQALGTLRHPDVTVPLGELFAQREAPLPLRAAALAALARLDGALAMSAAEAWAEDTGAAAWRQRFYAASGLAAARWNLAGSTLQKLARDADPRVAAAALDAMGTLLGDSIAPPRALLVEQLGAADIMVRAAALRVLGAKPQPADLGLFLDSYARAAADSLDDAALAAVDALEALNKTGAPAAHGFFARFQRSRDPIVRRAVNDKLGEGWGAVAPVETGRDSAFYLDVVRRLVAPALAGAPAPRVRVLTGAGTPARDTAFVLELDGAEAPLTVDNFLKLARMHYFDGAHWHRVVPNFVVQDGDPRGDGNGGPGWAIRDELNDLPYLRGALGMALSGPDTGGSQWFVTLSPQPHLDAGYTLFGHVLRGMDVIDLVTQDDIIRSVEVIP